MVEGDTLKIDRLLQNVLAKTFISGHFRQKSTVFTPDSGGSDGAKAWHLVWRIALARETRVQLQRGQKLTAGHARRGASLVHARHGGLELLIGLQCLRFEFVQGVVTEDLPPISFGQIVQGPAFFPRAQFGSLVGWGNDVGGSFVIRTDREQAGPGGGDAEQRQNECDTHKTNL